MVDLIFFDQGKATIAVRANTERGIAFMERYYGEVFEVDRHNEYLVPRLSEGEVRQAARIEGLMVDQHA